MFTATEVSLYPLHQASLSMVGSVIPIDFVYFLLDKRL